MRWQTALLTVAVIWACLLHRAAANKPPRFVEFATAFWVFENETYGYLVGHLKAEDDDDDEVTFSIQGVVGDTLLYLDQNDPMEAEIRLKGELDFEAAKSFDVWFEVADQVNTITRKSTLYVKDVNDNHPSFVDLPYRADLPEDSDVGTWVFQVSAVDPDSGTWGLVYYHITTPQNLYSINTGTGDVKLEGELDYEKEKFYQLEIMAMDGGGLSTTTDLVINVKDVQDTAPFFVNLPYIAEVYEDQPVGTFIIDVSAMDGDRGIPNPVNYTFIEGNYDQFHINSSTGRITVGVELDREAEHVLSVLGVMEMVVLTEEDTDTPQGPTTATAPVSIRILDVNDNPPRFNADTYTATVLENTQPTIPVTLQPPGSTITAWDDDEGDHGKFELTLTQDGEPFDVFTVVPNQVLNRATLLIQVQNTSALDYEVVKSYTFEMWAHEYLTTEAFSSSAMVTVTLQDVNDNWPIFDDDSYFATIPENSPKNTSVINVNATDLDSGVYGEITYEIRGASDNLFRVDPQTGEVYVDVDADLDHSLLDRETRNIHYLTMVAKDGGGLTTTAQLEVVLSDVNDNAPQILRAGYQGYVWENEDEMQIPLEVEATDIDLPPNNLISYHIVDGNEDGHFAVDVDTGQVTLEEPVDYENMLPESNYQYTLIVMAIDGGNPPLNNTVPVIINVQDRNDNEPKFTEELYVSVIPENSTGGTNVTTVHADDADGTAPNNEVVYRIDQGAKDKFRVHSVSGQITVTPGADLDRDVYGHQYTLTMLATDLGTPPLTGTTTVEVTITDVNNKPPVFDPDQRTTRLSEDAPVELQFYDYVAYDPDENALLRYRLLEDQVYGEDENKWEFDDHDYLNSLFGIHANNGSVYVKRELDRETVEVIRITVFVEDLNAEQPPIQNTTGTLSITLEDVNDNPPEFIPSDVYSAKVSEAAQPGAEVKKVEAEDKDKNADPVTYYMVYDTEQSHSFTITEANRETGMITLATEVDYEEYTWINITVMAMDSGEPPLNSTAAVHVEIEDVNDNSPEWEVFPDTVEVWENATLDTYVTYVYATDRDSGEYGHVMYYLTKGDDDKFWIHNTTGVLRTDDVIDRELVPTYSLTIEARDNNYAPASQQRTTPGYMTVILLDVNDNAPVFDKDLYQADTKENADLDTVVVTVNAQDPDEGLNAQVRYTVDKTQGNASHLFDVGHVSGDVYVAAGLHGEIGLFSLVVLATDLGDPPLSNSTTVLIHVEDVNEHAPVIISPPLNETIFIHENEPVGYYVTRVVATDEDEGQNGVVNYALVESAVIQDWQKFSIHPTEGNVTTAHVINREEQMTYYLEVRAYDLGTPSFEDRQTLVIVALDDNDNPPTFDRDTYPPPYHVSVLEEHDDIYVANMSLAEDPDIGNNSIICYYIVGGDMPYQSQFSLDKHTGDLWLRESLDREEIANVDLIIQADNDCWSDYWYREENIHQTWNYSDTTTLLVEVKVVDINDNPPRFTKDWFTAGVTKQTQYGQRVIDLSRYSYDLDEGNNSVMFYHLEEPFRVSEPLNSQLEERDEREPFTIGLLDGVIRTNIYFQESMEGYFEFGVYVNDSQPGHFDRSNVSIYLLSENQRVKVVIRGTPNEVAQIQDEFAEFLSNITGAIINVDLIRTHMDKDGKPDERRTDMFIHGIDPATGKVMDAHVLIDLIDKNYASLIDLFNTYNVIEIVPAVEPASKSSYSELILALVLVAAVLACLIIIICGTFWVCRKKYRRKLKAATAMAFGSRDSNLNRTGVPGTNLHTYEGSNPIWLEQYEQGWPKEDDTHSQNSLDVNAVPGEKGMVGGYDEQEVTMRMNNDEYDNFNKLPPANLTAALKNHKAPKPPTQNGKVPGKHAKQNGTAHHNGTNSVPNGVYDNAGFTNLENMPTTNLDSFGIDDGTEI